MPEHFIHTYLGDGAYASISLDGPEDALVVKANDHLNPTDSVYLGPNELVALIRFARLRGFLPEQNGVRDPKSAYLGDEVYVTHLSGSILPGTHLAVKANDHLNPTDSVVLGPDELLALIRFAQKRGILPEKIDEAGS